MRPIRARAKIPTKILHPVSNNRSDVVFTAEAADDGPVSGKIELRSRGMLGTKSQFYDLKPENRLKIGGFGGSYRLSVIPDQDVKVYFQTSHFQHKDLWTYIGVGFAALIGVWVLLTSLGVWSTPPS